MDKWKGQDIKVSYHTEPDSDIRKTIETVLDLGVVTNQC